MQADGDELSTLNTSLGLLQLYQLRLYLGMMHAAGDAAGEDAEWIVIYL